MPKIKNQITKVLPLFLFFSLFLPRVLHAEQWEELRGEHFIIYFTKEEKIAKQALDKSELYYRQVADNLGYQRYTDFWLWDKRCKIYLYPDHDSYLKATYSPYWSHGQANYTDKTISGYVGSQLFLDAILPHELGHLIFRDFVGFEGEIPLWLDEGVAQWQERAKPKTVNKAAIRLLNENRLIPLKIMMKLDVRGTEDKTLVNVFYVQSASLVDFLIRKYGTTKFTMFCQQLRDGKTLEEALKFSYSPSMRTVEDLEKEWRRYLLE